MNRSNLRQKILEALNESASSPVFLSTTQVDEAIEEGMDILAEEANAVKRTAYKPLQPGSIYYYTQGIAPDIMAPYRMWLTHIERRLTAVSIGELDAKHERWVDTTGDPEYWFPISWNLFGLWPGSSSGGGILRVDYLAWPRDLLDDSDEPEFLIADQDALVLYGIYDGLIKMLDVPKAMNAFTLFIERLNNAMVRSGINKMDARTFQMPQRDSEGFSSGVAY